jgi:carboxyl-terminal processing protease
MRMKLHDTTLSRSYNDAPEVPLISKSKYAALMLSSVLVVYAIVGGKFGRVSAQDSSLQQLDVFSQVFARIQNDYVDQPSMNAAITGAIRGLLEQVDPYAGYLTPKDVTFYKDFSLEKTPGIGVVLAKANGFPTILEAIPGGPAAKAGLKTFDTIEAIDGVPTREMNLVQAYGYLATPADKPVTLTLIGNNRTEPESVTLSREITKMPPVESKMLQNDIAYLRVSWLSQGRANDARKQLDDLLKKGATGVILDLRASAGGKDTEGFALANLFIDSGNLGSKKGQKVAAQVYQADPKLALTKSPLVVLVDGGTGGGAELAAAAISDSKRGKLVGTRTFGTGSIQTLINLDGGNALLISTAKYYSPSGKDIQMQGVVPDTRSPEVSRLDPNSAEALQGPAQKTDKRTDEEIQMEKAIEVLKDLRSTRRAA